MLTLLYGPTLTSVHDYWRNHSFDYVDFVSKVMSLLFNILSRFVIAFLPRSKHLLISWLQSQSEGFRVAQMVKRLPAMWETWVRSLGREDPLEKEMASHSSTLAWKIPWMEESGGLQSMVSQRVRHD